MSPPTRLERWHDSARLKGQPLSPIFDDGVKPIGEFVSGNLRAEAHLDPAALATVLSTFDENGPFEAEYDAAMKPLARQGGPAVIDRDLGRMMNARIVLSHDAGVFSGSPSPTSSELERFRVRLTRLIAIEPGRVDRFLSSLRMAGGPTCWATERNKLTDVDPATGGRDFGRLHDRLGLDWPGVAERRKNPAAGEILAAILHYDRENVSGIAVPTVADAGWNGLFRPSSAGAQIGMTIDRRGGVGLPEVVHDTRDCGCLQDRSFVDSGPIKL